MTHAAPARAPFASFTRNDTNVAFPLDLASNKYAHGNLLVLVLYFVRIRLLRGSPQPAQKSGSADYRQVDILLEVN